MKIYIDTEFNGWNGELISMALVADNSEFYEVVDTSYLKELNLIDPWVEEHVIPVLNKETVDMHTFQKKLLKFLKMYNDIEIVADWPDDISYLCKALITGPGRSLGIRRNVKFLLDYNLTSSDSKIPHNALEDARAIKKKSEELHNV